MLISFNQAIKLDPYNANIWLNKADLLKSKYGQDEEVLNA